MAMNLYMYSLWLTAFPRMMTTSSNSGPLRGGSDLGIGSSCKSSSRERQRLPLVDSDLLRFLSQSKRRQELQESQSSNISYENEGNISGTSVADSAAVAPLSSSCQREGNGVGQQPESDDAWLWQYERQRVALLLQEAGTEMAQAAAVAVETMAITRAARRRARIFLRERDQVWTTMNSPEEDDTTSLSSSTANENAKCSSDSYQTDDSNNFALVLELMQEYGLSAKDCAEILIQSPGIAFMRPKPLENNQDESDGETLQQTLDRAFVNLLMGREEPWQLGLRKYDARKVLRNTPGLLSVRGSKSATQMVQLLTRLGVSSNSLSRDKTALPILLSRQPSAVFRLVAFLSSDDVRMPLDKIGPLLRRTECQELLNAVAPVPRLEATAASTGYDPVATQVQREVVNNHYRNMGRTAWIMRNQIGTADLGKVIAACPSVLLLDAAKQILPTAHYLMKELGVYKDDLPRVLQLYPMLLQRDVEQMRNIVAYLISLEVDSESLGSIFRSFPNILTLDIEHDMEPVVEFLRNTVGIANVGRFITRLPPVLGYSVENELRPKYQFLSSVVTDPRFEASKFPAFFSYPLERGKMRFSYLQSVKGVPTALVAFDKVLCYGDRDFAMRVAGDRDNGAAYEEYVSSHLQPLAPTRPRRAQHQPSQPPSSTVHPPRREPPSAVGFTTASVSTS